MKLPLLTILAFLSGIITSLASDKNIVLIIADDLGWGDVGYNGSEIQTPHRVRPSHLTQLDGETPARMHDRGREDRAMAIDGCLTCGGRRLGCAEQAAGWPAPAHSGC